MPSISRVPLSGRYLSFAEREEIAILRARDSGVREIARRLGWAPSTVSRELRAPGRAQLTPTRSTEVERSRQGNGSVPSAVIEAKAHRTNRGPVRMRRHHALSPRHAGEFAVEIIDVRFLKSIALVHLRARRRQHVAA
jgi:IS30 family transposase